MSYSTALFIHSRFLRSTVLLVITIAYLQYKMRTFLFYCPSKYWRQTQMKHTSFVFPKSIDETYSLSQKK